MYLYHVTDTRTGEVWEVFAKDNLDALCKVPGGLESDPLVCPFRVKELTTPEGYRITTVLFIPVGEYFSLVTDHGKKPTRKTVYIRGKYDRSVKKFDCGYFNDISRNRYFRWDTLVTVDMTF